MDPTERGLADRVIPGLAAAVTRVEYQGDGLTEADCPQAPLPIALAWLEQAVARNDKRGDVPEPTALSVATVDASGMPDVRTVLMRFLDATGPAFLTNTDSAKGRQLAGNPAMAASLTWPSMFRAVRFRGYAQPLPRDLVTDYFTSRPYGSRIGAHASAQSRPATDRASLEAAYAECAQRWPDDGTPEAVPVPEHWGGYRLTVEYVELWAGRSNRLHDRFGFERVDEGGLDDPVAWRRVRLQP